MGPLQYRVLSLDLVAGLSHSKRYHREVRAIKVDQLQQNVDFGSRPLICGTVAGNSSALLAPKGDLIDKVDESIFGRLVRR